MRQLFLVVALAVIGLIQTAAADDFQYTSHEELQAEIASRKGDIERTRARLAELGDQVLRAEKELQQARKDGANIERLALSRTTAFYKIYKQGGSLRYLLESTSAVDFLTRLSTLKRLLIDSLEARRQAGLRIAAAEKQMATIQEDRRAAEQMHDMLQEALAELQREQAGQDSKHAQRKQRAQGHRQKVTLQNASYDAFSFP